MRTHTLTLLAIFLLLSTAPAEAAWQGQVATTDGVVTVTNPETPANGSSTQEMHELWRRGGDDDDIFFGTVAEFLTDADDNVYLLDGQLSEIQVFNPAGEHLRTIGRQGEGPGEFQNGADMLWAPNHEIGVVQAWPGKIVMITPEGDPGATFALPFRDGGGFQSVSRGKGLNNDLILAGTAWAREGENQMQFNYLKKYDASGAELATYVEISEEMNFGNYEFQEPGFTDFKRRWDVAPDGRVAAALSFDKYEITIWNADGTVDRVIERPDYQPVMRTAAEKDRFQAMYDAFTRWNRGSTFKISDHHQTIGQMFFRPDGTLWVQSSAYRWRAAEGVYTSFDVYDTVGRYLQRVDLIADADATQDGFYLAGGRAYIVTDLINAIMASVGGDSEDSVDDEAEPVEVIAFEFNPVVATGK